MSKSLIAYAVTAVAATLIIAPAANAGCGHPHGGGYSRSYSSVPSARFSQQAAKRRAIARAQAQRQQLAAARARAAKAERVAEAKAEAKKEAAAKVASADVSAEESQTEAAKPAEKKIETGSVKKGGEKVDVAAANQTCSRFVAAAGTTVTVDCNAK